MAATPGPARLTLELGLWAVAITVAFVAWPPWAALGAVVLVAAALVAGRLRARWLLQGATIG